MATTKEYTGVFTHVDDDGNLVEMYPEIKTDSTLTTSGKAADAAKVGGEITGIKTNLSKVLYVDSFDSSTGTLNTRSANYTG